MGKSPFRLLGNKLKTLRESLNESLAEVSGAVEIDIEALERIESGSERPSEDILMLLISHLGIKDDDASSLWKLAGFEKEQHGESNNEDNVRPVMMMLSMDPRIVYTDMVQVSANNYGVVMNFMQTNGVNAQPLAISRIGMSREHAQSVLELLQKTLAQANQPSTPRALPAPQKRTEKNSDTKQ